MFCFRRFALLLPIVAVLAGSGGAARTQDWPTRSVTVIVPFGAGGNTDTMARLGAQHLTAKFGQTFVIERGMQCCEKEGDYRPDTEKSCSASSSMP